MQQISKHLLYSLSYIHVARFYKPGHHLNSPGHYSSMSQNVHRLSVAVLFTRVFLQQVLQKN